MNFANLKTIAVDFDGTIVEDRYPDIGRIRTFAFETLLKLQQDGHRIILWTYRVDSKLNEAVLFCKENGLEFYAVNKNYPEEVYNEFSPRKLNVDIFIDDRNVGGFPGWGKIYHMLMPEAPALLESQKKAGLFGFLKKNSK